MKNTLISTVFVLGLGFGAVGCLPGAGSDEAGFREMTGRKQDPATKKYTVFCKDATGKEWSEEGKSDQDFLDEKVCLAPPKDAPPGDDQDDKGNVASTVDASKKPGTGVVKVPAKQPTTPTTTPTKVPSPVPAPNPTKPEPKDDDSSSPTTQPTQAPTPKPTDGFILTVKGNAATYTFIKEKPVANAIAELAPTQRCTLKGGQKIQGLLMARPDAPKHLMISLKVPVENCALKGGFIYIDHFADIPPSVLKAVGGK